MSWNKGNAHLSNRMEAIKQIILKNKPQVLVISELNFKQEDHISLTNIPGYTFECDSYRENNATSRLGMWIKNNLVYKCDKELETKEEALIG